MYASFMDDYMPITHGVKSGLGKNEWEEWIIDLFNNKQYDKAKHILKVYERVFLRPEANPKKTKDWILESRYLNDYNNYLKFVRQLEQWYYGKGV